MPTTKLLTSEALLDPFGGKKSCNFMANSKTLPAAPLTEATTLSFGLKIGQVLPSKNNTHNCSLSPRNRNVQ
jgi:hypothetical protein